MKISCNWLRDYTGVELAPAELADILTMSGLEVEGIETFETIKGGFAGLVVGEVLSAEKHPDADRLRVTKVDVGETEPLNIVCGAPNVAAGQKVIVALTGATLYPVAAEPFEIKKSKIRGALSEGMICAEDEIGLSGSHDGIIVLPDHLPTGMPAADYFKPYSDTVLDVNITANRGDAMSHIGVARDVLAWINAHRGANASLAVPAGTNELPAKASGESFDVRIENHLACKRYSGLVIDGLTVESSPAWMQNRLKAVGINPINNVVDTTNYVMLELGQPLHAFDANHIRGNAVVVKNLPGDTVFKALDGKSIKLHTDDLMICDAEGGMCIAGVYGGLDSGVTNQTTRIFLESATFDAAFVRKTMQRHNLRTDAATRFEKTTDPEMTVTALLRASALLAEVAGGRAASEVIDVYPNPSRPASITLSYAKLNAVAGIDVPRDAADAILRSLGFITVSQAADEKTWLVPGYKSDCSLPEDLIEEVLRIYGYEHITVNTSFQASLPQPQPGDFKRKLINKAFDFLTASGFNEAQNNSLASAAQSVRLWPQLEQAVIPLLSYSNAGLDALRVQMLGSLLQTVRHNVNRRQLDLKLFEYGKVYHRHNDGFRESEKLALLLTGNYHGEHWHTAERKSDFFHIKGLVESVLRISGVSNVSFEQSAQDDLLDSGWALKTNWLRFGKVKQTLLDAADVKQPVWYAEIDVLEWTAEAAKCRTQFAPPSKYPSVRRDLALVVPENIGFDAVETMARKFGGKQLRDVHLFDVFRDKSKLGDGLKSYAVSFVFLDDGRTLEEADIDKRMQQLVQRFETELNARIRQ